MVPSETLIRIVTDFVVPAGLVGLVLVTLRIVAVWMRTRSFDALPMIDRFLILLGGMLPAAILLIVISRYGFHQAYPELRTVLYWIPLLGLSCLGFIRRLQGGTRIERFCAVPLTAILVLCVIQFATQFNTRYYAEWIYCAAGKDMMQMVRMDHAGKPDSRVRVGTTWQLEPVVNFYRVAWGLDWMDPVERQSPAGNFDYYVLAFDDVSLIRKAGLKPLFHDRLSGTALAKRSDL